MAERNLFSNLQRLFSTDILVRNVGGDELKIADINQIQTTGKYQTNALLDRFSRLYIYNNKNIFNPNLNYQTLRIQLYSDYEAMDSDPFIASCLDILADEATLRNEYNEVLSIKSSDENIQRVLYNLYYDVLNIEFNLWSWIRNMCKYGDFFLKLEISEEFGVYNVLPYTVYHMVRHEGVDKDNPTKVTFTIDPDGLASSMDPNYIPNSNKSVINLDNYEVAHFRLIADTNYLPYGRSYIEPARKIYKQMTLMEDAMLIHRIMRAPEKRMFYINVGAIPPNEVEQFMQQTINQIKKEPYVDPQTGQYNLRFNLQNMMEDFYIPVRGNDQTTKIDTANGLQWNGIEDVVYLRDKLFAALKIPKAFMGYDENTDGKATLAAQDIRFARTIERLQRIIVSELYKIATIHLYTQGYRDESLVNFELSLTTPSIIYDQERVALMKEKVELANSMMESQLMPTDWIYENIFHLSEDQYDEYRDLIREDVKRKFRLSQIEAEGNDPVETGKSYGTPHDLATLYGTGRIYSNPTDVPAGYADDLKKNPLGRPKEKASKRNTQDDNFGKDRLGVAGMKKDYNSNSKIKQDFKGGSPLALESSQLFSKYESMLKNIPTKKQLVYESDNAGESLLDETNIKEQDF